MITAYYEHLESRVSAARKRKIFFNPCCPATNVASVENKPEFLTATDNARAASNGQSCGMKALCQSDNAAIRFTLKQSLVYDSILSEKPANFSEKRLTLDAY
jgi:hypothetical protein